jgi:hypothetical protein
MTKRHTVDYYMDGHIAVAFCKICSAEGEKLLGEECKGPFVSGLPYFRGMTKEEFDKKFSDKT